MNSSLENKKVSIVLCTLNEANHIEKTIELISNTFKNVEIIIIDDNSTDGTLEKLDKIKDNYNFKLFIRKDEKGLASAQQKGFKFASGDYIGTLDVNNQDQIAYFKNLKKKLDEGHDVAFLSRYIKGGGDERIFIRSIASKSINLLSKMILRIPYNDFTSGIFLMKKNLLYLTNEILTGYAEWFIDFIYIAHKKNYKIIEIPYLQRKDDLSIKSKSFPNLFTFLFLGFQYLIRVFKTKFRH